MLLFEDEDPAPPAEQKPEPKPAVGYLDEEHVQMLSALLAVGKGKLTTSEVIRQCIKLGYRTLQARQAQARRGGL